MHDSAARRRRRSLIGLVLAAVGIVGFVFGIYASQADAPPNTAVSTDGTTSIPATAFYQRSWVLFGTVDDPRRVPSLDEIGCTLGGSVSVEQQGDDLTEYGSRVVDGEPIAAMAALSRTGDDAMITCADAAGHDPMWLMPASDAPSFVPTSLAILGILLIAAGALVHPATAELPEKVHARFTR